MKEMKLNTALFGAYVSKVLPCSPGCTVGASVTLPAAFSKHRATAVSASAAAKISTVGWVTDKFLRTSEMAFAKLGADTIYAEFDIGKGQREQAVMSVDPDSNKIKATFSLNPEHVVAMMFVRALMKGDNAELETAFHEAVKQYSADEKVRAEQIALICDSFYYYTIKPMKLQPIEITGFTTGEINAVLRANPARPIKQLEGTMAGKPVETVMAKEKPQNEVPREKLGDFMKGVKNGDYLIDYPWAEDQEIYRQDLSSLDDFVPNEIFRSVVNKVKIRTDRVLGRIRDLSLDLTKDQDRVKAIGMDYINFTLSGKPGTGKTRLVHALGAATGLPVYVVSSSHNTDEDEFQGMTKMVDGHPTAVATDTVKCFQEGGILLLEEINLPQAAVVMGALGQAVEYPFILKKDGYLPIRRHPLCVIVSTMNTGTAGSKIVSQPFANRFKQSFVLDDPSRAEFVKILQNTGADPAVCRWVYEAYHRICACVEENTMADVESILLSLSLRSCIGAIENIQEGMDPKEAVINSIIGKISEQDRTVAKNCSDTVLNSMRDLIL